MSKNKTYEVSNGPVADRVTWIARDVECPHCGALNAVQIHADRAGNVTQRIVYCSDDDGGCDKMFVVSGVFRPTFVGATHKIEGLE